MVSLVILEPVTSVNARGITNPNRLRSYMVYTIRNILSGSEHHLTVRLIGKLLKECYDETGKVQRYSI
jgi:hypothetical protein